MRRVIGVFVYILIIYIATGCSHVFAVSNETQTQIPTSHPGSNHCQFSAPGAGCTVVDICLPNCKSCLGRLPHIMAICDISSNTCICIGWEGELMESEIKADINNRGRFDNGFTEIACEQILKTDEMVRLTEAGMCKSKIHHSRGGHLNSHNCYLVCRDARFSGGRCRGFQCRCFCKKLW